MSVQENNFADPLNANHAKITTNANENSEEYENSIDFLQGIHNAIYNNSFKIGLEKYIDSQKESISEGQQESLHAKVSEFFNSEKSGSLDRYMNSMTVALSDRIIKKNLYKDRELNLQKANSIKSVLDTHSLPDINELTETCEKKLSKALESYSEIMSHNSDLKNQIMQLKEC